MEKETHTFESDVALMERCLELHDMSLPQFSEFLEIPLSTLKTWKTKKLSVVGRALLKSLIRTKQLEERDAAYLHLKSCLTQDIFKTLPK